MRTVVTLMGALALGVVGFAGVAGAQQSYPPAGSCSLGVSSAVVSQRETITVNTIDCGAGYAPGDPVGLTFESTPVSVGTATADSNGQFSAKVTIPSDAARGAHTIRSSGHRPDGSSLELTAKVTVVAPGETAGAGALAFTGSDALPVVWIALVVLVLGSALVIGARRRATVRARQDASGP